MDQSPDTSLIEARKIVIDYSAVPKHWLANSAAATHLVNAVNLLFPAGERFFVRSVRHYESRVANDPVLTAQIRGFYGQEGNHAREHERFFEILEAQGYTIKPFLRWYKRFCYGFMERIGPPALRLSVTAAAEHYTAVLAEDAFQGGLVQSAHPRMRELFLWHASEEIEHKAVAFDLLKKVRPYYITRAVGFFFATFLLLGWWFIAFRTLMKQDGYSLRQALKSLRAVEKERGTKSLAKVLAPGMRDYLRRDFHPWQNNNLHLAKNYVAQLKSAA